MSRRTIRTNFQLDVSTGDWVDWEIDPEDSDTHTIMAAVEVNAKFTGLAKEVAATAFQKATVRLAIDFVFTSPSFE